MTSTGANFNYLELLIAAFFGAWSIAWASRDDLGYWGISMSRRAIFLASARLLLLFGLCAFLVTNPLHYLNLREPEWDPSKMLGCLGVPILFEFVNQSLFPEQPLGLLWRLLDRWRARLRYKDFRAVVYVLAFMSPFSALEQSVRTALSRLPNAKERHAKEVELELRSPDSSDTRRLAYATALLEQLSWSEIKAFSLVPHWALNPDLIADPESVVKELIDFCEHRAITATDLDMYIRTRLEGQPAAQIFYEKMLAEGQEETSERQRLLVRIRCLVWVEGPWSVVVDRDKMVSSIVANKRAAVAPVPSAKLPHSGTLGTLKLLSIELKNIRCFRSLELDFSENGKPRPWTMLLGDNGFGKTTILRSIIMALCDQTSATALMGRLPGELLRQQTAQGHIRVRLALPNASEEIWAETTLVRGPNSIELRQSTSTWFPRDLLFVCGYGALRNGFGTQSYRGYTIADASAGLFDPLASLQNPELALRRIMDNKEDLNRVCRLIERVLLLPENSMEFGSSGLSIKSSSGSFVPMGAIGDGYLATLAWLSDLLGWTFLYQSDFITGHVAAIVVIDEIEKHLHPRWQREIVRELSAQFPDVQFVVASHSPLCAGGLADLEENAAAMYRFEFESGAVIGEKLDPYRGWTYDQIMTSSAFGLKSVRDATTQEIVDELRNAHESGDEARVQEIEDRLESRSVTAIDDERERQVKAQLMRDLPELQRRAELQKRSGG